ncbi:uncharacterized protein [Mytilus edulis]
MKVAVILAIALAVLLIVHESEAGCASRCKAKCAGRRCKGWASASFRGRCYCKCFRCGSEHTMQFPENEGSSQMNEYENIDLAQDMPTGETEQGETGI